MRATSALIWILSCCQRRAHHVQQWERAVIGRIALESVDGAREECVMATAILLQLPLGNGVGKIGGKFKSMLQCLKKQHSDWRIQKRSFLSFRLLTTSGSLPPGIYIVLNYLKLNCLQTFTHSFKTQVKGVPSSPCISVGLWLKLPL